MILRLLFPPGRDLRMIPRSQHFGDRAPFPCDGPGIVRIFEQNVFERFVVPARSRAHYAGKQPNASVEQQQRAHLAARQDDVAHRHLLDGSCVEYPLVESLEPAAEDDRAGSRRRSEEHPSEIQSLMRSPYAVFCMKTKN